MRSRTRVPAARTVPSASDSFADPRAVDGLGLIMKKKAANRPPGVPPSPMRRSRIEQDHRVDDRRDPQTGVSDVTQLLSLTEESVMQNTMVRRPARCAPKIH